MPKLVKLRPNEATIGKARKTTNRITNGAAKAHPTRSSRQCQPEPGEADLAASPVLRWASAGTVISVAGPDLFGLGLHLVGCGLRCHRAGRQLLERGVQGGPELAPGRDRGLRHRALELLAEHGDK